MNKNRKKQSFAIYYIGIIIGTVLFHYMIHNHFELSENLYESFENMDKLDNINRKDLFLYLLSKRGKQAFMLSTLYYYLAENILIRIAKILFPVFFGMMISLFFYYSGLKGVFLSILLMSPLAVTVLGFLIYNSIKSENTKNDEKQTLLKVTVLLLFIMFLEAGAEFLCYFVLHNSRN